MHSRILLGVGLLGLVGCGVFGSDASPDPAPGAAAGPPAATEDGGLPEGAPPAVVGTPENNELTEQFGVFVSPTGTADGDGTILRPFATISAGIERVKDLKLRVYVCAGTYKESLTLVNAVSVIGALSCDGGVWKTGAAHAIVQAPTSPAVRAKDIGSTTRFEGFDVSAPAGTAMALSSIALIAENASKLAVANSTFTSGAAFDGTDGTDGVQLTLGAAAKGTDGLSSAGPGFLTPPAFIVGRQTGRLGGVGSCVGAAGHDGESGGKGGDGATENCMPANVTGPTCVWLVANGYDRSDAVAQANTAGVAGTDGASATSIGALSPDGYAPKGGTAGTDGAPGKGGTGGNGGPRYGVSGSQADSNKYYYGAAGAGGGAGGCPGLAGTAGAGGGASIAALVFASPGLTFTTVELKAGNGGRGGKGTFGSLLQPGGKPGTTPAGASPATGGSFGGRAGFSGNGAGGPSAALAFTGGAVVLSPDTHTTAGTAGAGVAARTEPFTSVTMPASATGLSMPVLQF